MYLSECIQVCVRLRPMNTKEKNESRKPIIDIFLDDNQVLIKNPANPNDDPKSFTFDAVYDEKTIQKNFYDESCFSLVESVLEGFNGTIFAYGQTASGKTYTMEGDLSISNLNGIIPRIIHALYNTIDVLKNDDDDIEYEIIVNFVEIYMEKIRDLLDNKRNRVNLNIREDKDKGIYIEGAKDQYVRSVDDMMNVMIKGTKNRSVAATGMNEVSSRSHSIFIIKINRF